MNLLEKIKQPEGRKLEFKEILPATIEVAKTIIAFANDAGGELFVGVKNEPREISGIQEHELDIIENKICNLINDLCEPTIQPEISYIDADGKKLIRIFIHKGIKPPYHLKSKGVQDGTYIRVGSSNRQASADIIEELKRISNNLSFDAEIEHSIDFTELELEEYSKLFLEKTGEELTEQVMRKLDLIVDYAGRTLPTYALILLSDSSHRRSMFPYAKIECARFKGTKPGDFIDSKTIDCNISAQADEAYKFVMRHVNIGTANYQGVYHNQRWEYPMIAIREVIRNAVIHRDYSLTGKDIKIAIFDDKIEITSPGKLMPSVDFNQMDAGQSDVRNKILAPVFKRLGIIEQWGNGLQLIADDLKSYPEIKMVWNEPGLAFRLSFILNKTDKQQEFNATGAELGARSGDELGAELRDRLKDELNGKTDFSETLTIIFSNQSSSGEIANGLGKASVTGSLKRTINKLLEYELIERTIPDKPTSRNQKYKITNKGILFLNLLNKDNK